MNIEQKALGILREIAHKVAEGEKYSITLTNDWGFGSATVEIAGLGHTHVGNDVGTPEECFASFIDGLYDLLIEGRGLSMECTRLGF